MEASLSILGVFTKTTVDGSLYDLQTNARKDTPVGLFMLHIDHREQRLHSIVCQLTEACILKPLQVGDIEVYTKAGDHVATFERKSLSDLVASVKDGRWDEQKCRLGFRGRQCYIIEGKTSDFDAIAWGCLVHTMLRDRVPCMLVEDVAGTAKFLIEVLRRNENIIQGGAADVSQLHDMSLCRPSLKKNENIGPRQVLLTALAAVPMVSVKTADRIATHFGFNNLSAFVQHLGAFDETNDKVSCLTQVKGVGSKMAQRIVEAIFGGIALGVA